MRGLGIQEYLRKFVHEGIAILIRSFVVAVVVSFFKRADCHLKVWRPSVYLFVLRFLRWGDWHIEDSQSRIECVYRMSPGCWWSFMVRNVIAELARVSSHHRASPSLWKPTYSAPLAQLWAAKLLPLKKDSVRFSNWWETPSWSLCNISASLSVKLVDKCNCTWGLDGSLNLFFCQS